MERVVRAWRDDDEKGVANVDTPDDDLDDEAVARDGEYIRVPLKFMDDAPPQPLPAAKPGRLFVDQNSPSEIAYLKHKAELPFRYLAKPPAPVVSAPVRDAPPLGRSAPVPAVVSEQDLRDARAVVVTAWLKYVERQSNMWKTP
jgi:hypothetical protein